MKYVSPSDAAVTGSAFEDFEVQNDKLNKEIVAANVVQELLNSEEKLFPNPKDRRMLRQLSSGNKVWMRWYTWCGSPRASLRTSALWISAGRTRGTSCFRTAYTSRSPRTL